MRKLTLLPFLLGAFCASAFGASSKQLLGARSAHHELRVERSVVAADRIAYDVAVVDLDSGKTVVSSQVSGKPGQAVEVTGASGGSQIRVRLADISNVFSATVEVIDGKTIVDQFRASLTPVLNAPGAFRVGGDVKAPV